MFPVSDPQIKLTHCLLAALCMKVTVGVLLLTFHKEFHSNRGRVFQESRTEFSTYLLSCLSLSVFLCLSPSSCAPWSVPSGRPDAAAAAVSRLHASDQHVICQICHLSSTLRHHGTLFWNKVFFGLNLKVFFPWEQNPWNPEICVSVFLQRVYRALYDYVAQDHDEVSFRDGDVIINAQPIDEGWMYGTVQRTGKSGMLPANYVECCN